MKVVCAWCGKEMGEKNGGGVEGVSHSICEECLECLKELEAKAENEGAEDKPDE